MEAIWRDPQMSGVLAAFGSRHFVFLINFLRSCHCTCFWGNPPCSKCSGQCVNKSALTHRVQFSYLSDTCDAVFFLSCGLIIGAPVLSVSFRLLERQPEAQVTLILGVCTVSGQLCCASKNIKKTDYTNHTHTYIYIYIYFKCVCIFTRPDA